MILYRAADSVAVTGELCIDTMCPVQLLMKVQLAVGAVAAW